MKRFILSIMTAALIVSFLFVSEVRAETYVPTRTINLVYDDSGSMIRDGNKYVDTWCQAKYAMEVVAGMLGERETLNIYYMSDYDSGSTSAGPKLVLKGSKDASVTEANVKKIHNLVTDAGNTPFASVKKAYTDLKKVKSDERWLVVLTDGEFNGTKNSTVESYFDSCVADGQTRVMMLSMGPNAAVITPDPDKNIYFEKAENTTDILSKLTKICNRIFQSNALELNSNNEVSFNVPMSQLLVFAQGKNVKIEGISTSKDQDIKATSNVHVQYSKVATVDKNYPASKVIVADNLNGYVATFNQNFEAGDYKINVSDADDVQVYYKPDVSVAAYLYNEKNVEVTAEDNLVAGTYRLEFGFVNAHTGEKITDTSLLGNIEYTSSIVNTTVNNKKIETQAKPGDMITLKNGKIDIDVTVKFLEYNTVRANLSYQVYSKSDLVFSFDKKPTYTLNTDGFTNPDDPMILRVKMDNGDGIEDLTKDQLYLLGTPTITTKSALGEFRVENGDEAGTFKVYPTLKNNDPLDTATGEVFVTVSGNFKQGLSSAQGELEDSFQIETTITTLQRIIAWLKVYGPWIAGILLFLILLMIILHLKRLPKYAHITKRESNFNFDGEDESKSTNFSASMSKGQLSVVSKYAGVKSGLIMSAKPGKESYLRKPQTKRYAEVDTLSVRKYGTATITEASIGSVRYTLNEETGKLESKIQSKKPILLKHGTPITYSGTMLNAGIPKPFSVSTKLNYKKKK